MMDSGYSLLEMEIFNWGNFHGYQKLSLRQDTEVGGLLAPPQASAILGLNGSGKTTLIDAMMITLLPFENAVKLGVTNDYETGAGGGRTIRDYVLGKFASSENAQTDLGDIYGRKTGCSIVLLRFQHNAKLDRRLTLGRIWWYSNYKVADSQLGFLAFDDLSIENLCPGGQVPKSGKVFKTQVKELPCEVQVFETLQAYFAAVSAAFGGIQRDDLKLLNRAFYVKSISQIDGFIKENMLLAAENPHLDRLLENVRNGQEIASAIDTCERKLASIRKILGELERLEELAKKIKELQMEQSLLELLPDFIELENFKSQIQKDREELVRAEVTLPNLERQLAELEFEMTSLRTQLAESDAAAQLALVENQLQHLQEKMAWSEALIRKWGQKLAPLKVALPSQAQEQEKWTASLQKVLHQIQDRFAQVNQQLDGERAAEFELQNRAQGLRQEIEHLTRSGSLIPQRIYEIKERAMAELKIGEGELRFFAELVQVPPEYQEFRRPVEAVFFGVARNLLCHPRHLKKLTQWLDKTGLKADITVKRIREEELESGEDYAPLHPQSILSFIEILPQKENPFYYYVERWSRDVFDYQLVEVAEFKSANERLVTREGLLKNDMRTMRKLKKDFSYSLGWDNQSVIEQKTHELVQCGQIYQDQRQKVQDLEKQRFELSGEEKLVEELLSSPDDITLLCSAGDLKRQNLKLQRSLKELESSQPELKRLKNQLTELEGTERAVRKSIATVELERQERSARILKTEQVLPLREKAFLTSRLFSDFESYYLSAERVLETLRARNRELEETGRTRLEASSGLIERRRGLENKRSSATARAGSLLNEHQRTFADPGVGYQLRVEEVEEFTQAWVALRVQLENTELPKAKEKWQKFFDQILIDSVKDTLNEIKARLNDVSTSIDSINEVLKLTNFEELPDENRYLQIVYQASSDDRIRKFRKSMQSLESVLGTSVRLQDEGQSATVMAVLIPFVEEFQKEVSYRDFVTDVRNHYSFRVHSLRREKIGEDSVVEIFSGARKDAKSSAQTTQLAYALLASSLAYRFRFHDSIAGRDTPRLIILDEFGGKFDNEKPKEIVKLLDKMGFQSILLSPMSKADLLAESIGQMVLVYKLSASQSKVASFEINSLEDYHRLLQQSVDGARASGDSPTMELGSLL